MSVFNTKIRVKRFIFIILTIIQYSIGAYYPKTRWRRQERLVLIVKIYSYC